MLASVAHAMLRDRARAEDVVQDVFLALVRSAASLRTDDGIALRAWLVRTTRNRCIDLLRSASTRHERSAEDPGRVMEPTAPLDRPPSVDELDPALARALDLLTPDQRLVLLLRHVEGFTTREVARMTGRSRAAVHALVARAQRVLRAELAGHERRERAEGRHDR